ETTPKALRDRLSAEAFAAFDAAGIDYKTLEDMHDRRKGLMELGEIEGVGRAGGSTFQSIANGKADIETDYLNGEIVKLGRLHGVPTPANATMQKLMARMIRKRIEPRSFNLEEVEELVAAEE
ncbi:MAG: ketopantoate reductase C-terminal domain-containing protein, partial [Pseudomonadota bacterium]|nr:ketopantoate reductase C-terminal domain-containing protein [Pseudomonadota bacterium]